MVVVLAYHIPTGIGRSNNPIYPLPRPPPLLLPGGHAVITEPQPQQGPA